MRVTAPLVLHNALPMPVHAIAYGLSSWMNIRCAALALATLSTAEGDVLTYAMTLAFNDEPWEGVGQIPSIMKRVSVRLSHLFAPVRPHLQR